MNYDRTSPDIETDLPDAEAAGAEYLLDLAFDDRLERVLSSPNHDMYRFDIDSETIYAIDKDFVPHTHTRVIDSAEEPICKVKIDGMLYKGQSGNHLSVRFMPDIFYADASTLTVDQNGHILKRGASEKRLSAQEAAGMILRTTGTDSSSLDDLISKRLIDSSMCMGISERALHILADQQGRWSRERSIEIAASDSTLETPIRIRLGHIETGSPDESTIKLVIEKVRIHTDLNAEEAYRFVLFFSAAHAQDASQEVSVSAEKSVRGDGFSLQSANFIHMDAHGTPTELDYSDPEVIELFVHAYEELVDSIDIE